MSGIGIGLTVLACFFAAAFLAACYLMVNRMAGIEEGIEKVSILMTVMANKQGATQDDIVSATTGNSSEGKSKK
ncbi:MAG: hypothetical protein Q4F00_04840 [bacterium]|nr:hypothetical protein [bacterium]